MTDRATPSFQPLRGALAVVAVLGAVCLGAPTAHAQTEDSAAAVVRMEPQSRARPVPDFDLRQMRARAVTERQLRQPVVHWETLQGTFAACPQATGAQDLNLPEQGCAVVDTAQNRCTIYTASRTTHSIMGHLVRHCFEGRL